MATIPGTNTLVSAPLAPYDSADTYPTHNAIYGKGGFRSVANSTERLGITQERLDVGMFVFEVDTEKLYVYKGNNEWEEWESSGGGGSESESISRSFTNLSTWTIQHNLNKYPSSVYTRDNSNDTIIGDVEYTDLDTITIQFSEAVSGTAYLTF